MRDTMRQLLGRKSNARITPNQDEISTSKPLIHLPLKDTHERVFPIRHIHNARSNTDVPWLANTSSLRAEGPKYSHGHTDSSSTVIYNEDSFEPPGNEEQDVAEHRKVTERSKFLFLNSGPVNVLPGSTRGSDGTPYRRCEDEPIHMPGAIQSYGALLGLKYSPHGHLEVRVASENTRKILGYGPEQLFTMPSFLDALRQDGRVELTARINHVLRAPDALKEETRLDVFQIYLTFPYEPEIRLWCAIHLAPSPANMVICEFEEYLDAFYLNDMRMAKTLPESPVRHMDHDVTPEEFEKSTTKAHKPLPVLEIARTRKNREFSSLDVFNAMSQAQQQISGCKSVQELMDVTVGIIAELTGFHRVMFYRFDAQKNGCVDAELLNPRACTDVFRGMHFPAADIPKQARDLYIINRIRILHDRVAETARLVCRDETDIEQPLDLTHSYLRAMSPVHNKYLKNMSVRSTLSISIVIDNDLWGLIACHGYGDAGIRVSLPIRELCRNIGECAAINIQQLIMRQRLQVRRPPPVNPSSQTPASYLAATGNNLLSLVNADFAMLSIEEESRAIGRLDPYQEALAIMTYLQTCRFTEIRSSVNINADFPGIVYPPGINTIAGLLIIPFNIGDLNDFLVFFRKGELREVKWAGNPYDKTFRPGSDYLDPRSSFHRWTETIVGTCREWTSDQLDTASVLSLLYGRFVEIWRQKGSAPQNDKMSMIRTSSCELRNPLNTITGYLEMALENKLDSKTRHFLSRAQEASKTLATVVDELGKLTNTEDGAVQPTDETFNLSLTVSRLSKTLQKEAHRKSLVLSFSVHERLPAMVRGDSERFRHLIAHLTNNAFKQCSNVKVDVNLIRTKDDVSIVGLSVQDSGPGMSEAELDSTFQELEQAHDDDDWLFTAEDSKSTSTVVNSEASADLAIIARYVRGVNGQIHVTSELGKGTVFTIELPFEHVESIESSKMPRRLRTMFSLSSNSGKVQSLGAVTQTSHVPMAPRKVSKPSTNSDETQRRFNTPGLEPLPPPPLCPPPPPQEFRAPSRVETRVMDKEERHHSKSETSDIVISTSNIRSYQHMNGNISMGERRQPQYLKPKTIDMTVPTDEVRSSAHTNSNISMMESKYRHDSDAEDRDAFLAAKQRSSSRASSGVSREKEARQSAVHDHLPAFEGKQPLRTHDNMSVVVAADKDKGQFSKTDANSPSPTNNVYSPRIDSIPCHPVTDKNIQKLQFSKTLPPRPNSEQDFHGLEFVLNILIAEDNFVTHRKLDKHLSQLGHIVTIASDGQECHDRFVASSNKIDIIFMDMKMPLVDGMLSMKMIRFWERESKNRNTRVQSPKPRVPIIAVVEELREDKRFEYIQSGFDGWMTKPIELQLLNLLLPGSRNRGLKKDALYVPGGKGGWFFP